MEKRPNDLSSGIVRAVSPLIAGGSGGESSCAGTQLPDWGRMGGDEPWCRLSLVTAGIATGSGTSGVSGLKPKPSRHIR